MPSDSSVSTRIHSIDMMRGLVMLLMLVDHVRERFYLHMQVSDPMTLDHTSAGLFVSRLLAHLCAPTFIFLTGVSAWLYQHSATRGPRPLDAFLLKRGLFLILLEITLVSFSWMGSYHTLWLQVMWAIGLCMLSLALLYRLPKRLLWGLALLLMFAHNLLTPIHFSPDEWGYSLWTILHDRGYLVADGVLKVKVSYPVLPWIGVILLGYLAGPLYHSSTDSALRRRCLLWGGCGALLLFVLLRGGNIYGETLPWQLGDNWTQTLMSLLNVTKYPPSLAFLLLTLGLMALCLRAFEQRQYWFTPILSQFGGAPMFFYLLHLYVLLLLYSLGIAVLGPNQGELLSVAALWQVWLIAAILAFWLYWPTKAFAAYKRRSRQPWLAYL